MDAAPDLGLDVGAVVLVEGRSDQAAVEALARRRGRDLAAEDIAVVSVGGATTMGRYLDRFGPHGLGPDLAARGFYVCEADLEDELIRALGVDAVVEVITAQGELPSLRMMQQQPAQRDRPVEAQLRRFMGTKSGRKVRYGRLLVEALDLTRVPRPLDAVLAAV